MNRVRPICILLPLLAVLAGCGKAASPAVPVAVAAPVAPVLAAQAAPEGASIITSHTGRVAPTVTAARGPAASVALAPAPEAELADAPAGAAPVEDLAADGPDDPPMIAAYLAAEDPPSYNVDDRTPYNVVIPARSAHTTTIAWHTEVPTRAIIEYGRAWGFDKNGYTHKVVDDVAKTDHQYTLTELRRWTGYVYRVTAVTPLGLKFPEQERKFRTKFWSWR